MNTNPGIDAVRKLAALGFRFRIDGEAVKVRYEGTSTPDPKTVSPLLDKARQHREDVRHFLKCYCPRCGGVCFIPDLEGRPLCLACDWQELGGIFPGLEQKH